MGTLARPAFAGLRNKDGQECPSSNDLPSLFLIQLGQQVFDRFELLTRFENCVDLLPSIDGRVSQADERSIRLLHDRLLTGLLGRQVASDHQRELGHLATQLGNDSLGSRGADAGKRGQFFDVLLFDGNGNLAHRTDHRSQSSLHTDAVHRADALEEFLLRIVEEADQTRRQSAPLLRISFEVLDGPQADVLIETPLKLSPHELWNEDLVLERPNRQRRFAAGEMNQSAGDAGDQEVYLGVRREEKEDWSLVIGYWSLMI